MKYLVITGGVVSGLGKGITISSIGRIIKSTGLSVTAIKIDPYLNVDAGTMSPFEHGETFVLDDGGETDLDLGNYERFLDITLTAKHNITSGKVYQELIRKERRGDYLGKTVQMVPHATDLIQEWIKDVASISVDGSDRTPDVCLIEVGGTVGDIESMIFLEALRQFQFLVGRENIAFVHVSLVPVLGSVGEQKTKPTQHSVKELRALGLSADIIVCRSSEMLLQSTKNKISSFCHVDASHIISVHDVSNIYHRRLSLENMATTPDLVQWRQLAMTVDIAIVGKYNGLGDSYLSLTKALTHSAIHLNVDGKQDAHSTEFDPSSKNPVVIFMPEGDAHHMGGTMRLGARCTAIALAYSDRAQQEPEGKVYGLASLGSGTIWERHRHRYEVNPTYVEQLEKAGLQFTGRDDTGVRMEIVELPATAHPFFFGTQYHPEFKSRPNRPSPPFFCFVSAAAKKWKHFAAAGVLWQREANNRLESTDAKPTSICSGSIPIESHPGERTASSASTPHKLTVPSNVVLPRPILHLSPSSPSSSKSSLPRAKNSIARSISVGEAPVDNSGEIDGNPNNSSSSVKRRYSEDKQEEEEGAPGGIEKCSRKE
eukprot:gene29812-38966_t